MGTLGELLLMNALIVVAMAIGVLGITAIIRQPAFVNRAWLLVLLKLLIPAPLPLSVPTLHFDADAVINETTLQAQSRLQVPTEAPIAEQSIIAPATVAPVEFAPAAAAGLSPSTV